MPYDPSKSENFLPSPEEQALILSVWDDFIRMYRLKAQTQDILGGANLQSFWDASNQDYNVLVPAVSQNDPVKQYVSTISRDKADVFISNLTQQLFYPNVMAVNQGSKLDKIMSKVSRAMLKWAHDHDGFPSESGHEKMARYIHKMVVEGTVHIQDDVMPDGRLESSLVPNEEIFLDTYWQPDIQKHNTVIRAQLNVTYEELEAKYGLLPNWKYVRPGFNDFFFVQRPYYKQILIGIAYEKGMQVVHRWRDCSPLELKQLKAEGKIRKSQKKAKYFNTLINNVPMFPVDTLLPYEDGLFPINKGIFCKFAKAEYYWGNSMPNKVRFDKEWYDNWKTLMRWKAKAAALPPLISKNGEFVDESIYLPGNITPVTEMFDIEKVKGVGEPLNDADFKILELATQEIDRGTVSPQANGDPGEASVSRVATQNAITGAAKLQDAFALQVTFLINARTYPILRRVFQFLPRAAVKQIAVPDQTVLDGRQGSYEIIFESIPDMTPKDELDWALEIHKEQKDSIKSKNPVEKIFINSRTLDQFDFFLTPQAGTNAFGRDEQKRQEFERRFETVYLSRPDLFNIQVAARKYVQYNDDDDDILNEQHPQQGQMQPGQPGQQQPAMAGAPQGPLPQPLVHLRGSIGSPGV